MRYRLVEVLEDSTWAPLTAIFEDKQGVKAIGLSKRWLTKLPADTLESLSPDMVKSAYPVRLGPIEVTEDPGAPQDPIGFLMDVLIGKARVLAR